MIALKWVTLNFALHLILRGYWVALLCVNSAFPGGIDTGNIKLQGKYRDDMADNSLPQWLIRLDKTCGLIFYSAFAIALFIIGMLVSIGLCAIIAPWAVWLTIVLFTLLMIFYTDLITFGILRRNAIIGKIYFPVYSFFNVLTLTFLFRKPLQIISTNAKRLPVTLYLIIVVTAALALSYLSLYKPLMLQDPFGARLFPSTLTEQTEQVSEKMYLDKISDEETIRWYAIESEIADHDFVKIFVNYREPYVEGIANANANAFDQIVTVKLDDIAVNGLQWTSCKRTYADQYGIITMLAVSDIAKGKHLISVHIADDYFTSKPIINLNVPFWKE